MNAAPRPPRSSEHDESRQPRLRCPLRSAPRWLLLACGVPLITGTTHWLRRLSDPIAVPLQLELAAYALVLLLAAALLYRVGQRLRWCAPWATALAGAAAIEMVLLRLAGIGDGSALPPTSMTAYLGLGLLLYLAIELHYRDRRAGPIVMPIVALALGAQLYLSFLVLPLRVGEIAIALSALAASVLATMGYLLLAAGGAFALQTLRTRASGAAPSHAAAMTRMLLTNRGGVVLFAIAALVWEVGTQLFTGIHAFLTPVEPWAIGVLVLYAGHLVLHRLLAPSPRVTAGWAAALFGTSAFMLSASVAMARGWSWW